MLKIYLDKKAMLEAGATVEEVREGSSSQTTTKICFRDYRITLFSEGKLHVNNRDILEGVPEGLEEFVVEVSYYGDFGHNLTPQRQIGEYRFLSATADIKEVGGRDSHYQVRIYAKTLDDLRELHGLIRQGLIWPVKDYEAEQVPPPFRHFRDLIKEMWQIIRRGVTDRLYRIKERVFS